MAVGQSERDESTESSRSGLSTDLAADAILWLTPLMKDCLASLAAQLPESDAAARTPPFQRQSLIEALRRGGSTTAPCAASGPRSSSLLMEDVNLIKEMILQLEQDLQVLVESCRDLAQMLDIVLRKRLAIPQTNNSLSEIAASLSEALLAKEQQWMGAGLCGTFAAIKAKCPSCVEGGNLQREALLWLPRASLQKLPKEVLRQRISMALAPWSRACWQYQVALHHLQHLPAYLEWETSLRKESTSSSLVAPAVSSCSIASSSPSSGSVVEDSRRLLQHSALARTLREALFEPVAVASAVRAFADGGFAALTLELQRLVEEAKEVVTSWNGLPLPAPDQTSSGSGKKTKMKGKGQSSGNAKAQKQKPSTACNSDLREPPQKQARHD